MAAAADPNGAVVLAGHDWPWPRAQMPGRRAWGVVDAEEPVDGEPLEQAVFDHRLGPSARLLGGLEDGTDGAVEAVFVSQERGGPQEHRHVAVVSAGMHRTCVARHVLDAAVLGDGQSVELRAQPHRPARCATGQRRDESSAADARFDDVPELAQDARNVGTGRSGLGTITPVGRGVCFGAEEDDDGVRGQVELRAAVRVGQGGAYAR